MPKKDVQFNDLSNRAKMMLTAATIPDRLRFHYLAIAELAASRSGVAPSELAEFVPNFLSLKHLFEQVDGGYKLPFWTTTSTPKKRPANKKATK